MKNIVDFPDQAVIDDEAAEWLMRLDGDEPLSEPDRQALAQWLQRSPAHCDRLTALAELWGRLNALTELAVPLAPARPKRTARRSLFAAAGVAMACLALFVVFPSVFQAPGITATNGLYSSAIGEQSSSRLADGSEIFLNTNSQIRVVYQADSREIHLLQGEVLFTVAKDLQRPFRVHAGGGMIEAVGTEFSVYLKDDAVDITVTEGIVALSTDQLAGSNSVDDLPTSRPQPDAVSSATLSAGQIASLPRFDAAASSVETAITDIASPRQIQRVEMARRMSWTEGSLIFSGESLEHVVGEISRYTTVKIDFADPEVRSIRVGGVFPVGETAAMFDALESTFGLQVRYLSTNRVMISAGE